MKFLFLLLSLCTAPLFADIVTVRVNAAITNIPTTFSTGATSLLVTGIHWPVSIMIDNTLNSNEIVVNCSGSSTVAPSTNAVSNIYIQSQEAWSIDNPYFSGNCYIRSNTGSAITSGIVVLTLVTG